MISLQLLNLISTLCVCVGSGTDDIAVSSSKGFGGAVSRIFLNMLVPRADEPPAVTEPVAAVVGVPGTEETAGTTAGTPLIADDKASAKPISAAVDKVAGPPMPAKKAAGVDKKSSQIVYDSRIGVVSLNGELGISNGYFDCTIPRQKWTHIAFVCTRRPKNRITCYKVYTYDITMHSLYYESYLIILLHAWVVFVLLIEWNVNWTYQEYFIPFAAVFNWWWAE